MNNENKTTNNSIWTVVPSVLVGLIAVGVLAEVWLIYRPPTTAVHADQHACYAYSFLISDWSTRSKKVMKEIISLGFNDDDPSVISYPRPDDAIPGNCRVAIIYDSSIVGTAKPSRKSNKPIEVFAVWLYNRNEPIQEEGSPVILIPGAVGTDPHYTEYEPLPQYSGPIPQHSGPLYSISKPIREFNSVPKPIRDFNSQRLMIDQRIKENDNRAENQRADQADMAAVRNGTMTYKTYIDRNNRRMTGQPEVSHFYEGPNFEEDLFAVQNGRMSKEEFTRRHTR
jgi:hypothetical protein